MTTNQSLYYIKATNKYGRGLYASKNIKQGSRIMLCELLVLSPEDTLALSYTSLADYVFTYNEKQDTLVLGDAELFNDNGNKSNVSYYLRQYNGRTVMEFIANQDIALGRQLFIDYSADLRNNESKSNYSVNLIG